MFPNIVPEDENREGRYGTFPVAGKGGDWACALPDMWRPTIDARSPDAAQRNPGLCAT
jgi:hypothetical protein